LDGKSSAILSKRVNFFEFSIDFAFYCVPQIGKKKKKGIQSSQNTDFEQKMDQSQKRRVSTTASLGDLLCNDVLDAGRNTMPLDTSHSQRNGQKLPTFDIPIIISISSTATALC
jgi:hypothetical protein